MKLLGARCVVWWVSFYYADTFNDIVHRSCLDDEELEFLIGVSWIEYCQVAHREGLDVLRYAFRTVYPFSH